ncbi:MAG: cadherin domain-containing protein, partial [Prochlorotrichaceae cyanobacterium]
MRVYANHELCAGTCYAYQLANGTFLDGGRVSYFDINKNTRTLEATGLAYDTIYNRAGEVVDSPDDLEAAGFDRFCSAQYIEAEQFGAGRGLVDGIFFTGEETDGGTEFALDPDTNTLYAVPWMGRAAWESVTELDTGTTDKIALLVGDDRGGAPMLLYVGDKGQGTGPDFLVRNGLASGKLYVWVATSGETTPTQFNGTGENRDGSFVAIDYYRPDLAGNGEYDELGFATQDKQDALAAEVGAFQFSRPEDLATNPVDGTQAVLASTGRDSLFPSDSWGTTYIVDTDFSDLNNITANVKVIYDGDDAGAGQFAGPDFGLRSPDNLDWADNGQIYIQEDRSFDDFGLTSGEEASIWRLDPTSGVLTRVAQMDRNALPDGQTDRSPTDIGNWESSGIIDVSTLFGEDPGQLFLFDVQAHSLRDGAIAKAGLVQGGQLAFLELTANRPVFAEETIAITIADDLEDGDLVGEPITATDADEGDSLTYSITGGNEDPDEDQKAAFAIDTSTGQITVNDADDLALLDVFNLTVTVTDSTGLKDTTQVTVDVSRFEETGTTGIFTISSLDVRNLVIQTINNLDINIGIFFVDDALGSIDGILPGDDGYQEAAAGRAISLLAALASTDNPNAPGQLKKVLGLKSAASLVSVQQSTDFFFGFLSVEQVSIGDLFAIVNGSSSLSLSGLKISLSTDDDGTGITSDGDGGFIFTFGGIEFSVSFNADEIEDAFGGLLGID